MVSRGVTKRQKLGCTPKYRDMVYSPTDFQKLELKASGGSGS